MTLVDTDALLDLVTADPVWADWSLSKLRIASLNGALVINDVIYAELSTRFESMERLDQFVSGTHLELLPMPRSALFLAAKAFGRYRKAGGRRDGVLSDFFIGAHASVLGIPLLTRDMRHYRSYFPAVRLISPNMG